MQDKLGEIFVDGKIINLDTSTIEVLNRTKEEIQIKQKESVKNIDNILSNL